MLRRTAHLLAPLVLLASLASCSSQGKKLHLTITTGHETDTFSMDPPVTRITISAKSPDGSTAVIATTTPGGTFDLGEVVETESVGFEVSGFDIVGHLVVRGRSLGAISLLTAGTDTTLPVFAQRVRQWARPPGELSRVHVGAPTGVLDEQYVWQSGGTAYNGTGEIDGKESDFYDLFNLTGATGPTLDRAPESIVSRGQAAQLFDAQGGMAIDFSAQTKGDLALPEGLGSFAEIAGGRPVSGTDGTTYIVGGSRAGGEASDAVLIIAGDGTLSATRLNSKRLGAAVLVVPDLGLVVAGGSDEGAGIEVLPSQTTKFVAGGYPIDPVVGAAAVLDPRDTRGLKVLLLGGHEGGKAAPSRLLDLNCATACPVTPLPTADLPRALGRGVAFILSDTQVITVGDEAAEAPGETHSYVVDLVAATVTEAVLREPRKGASVVPTPLGTLAMLGGVHLDGSPAFAVETFFP
ncbi:MAG: hypothetical protein ABI193_09250 [Minicystis sp.]